MFDWVSNVTGEAFRVRPGVEDHLAEDRPVSSSVVADEAFPGEAYAEVFPLVSVWVRRAFRGASLASFREPFPGQEAVHLCFQLGEALWAELLVHLFLAVP